MKPTEQAYVFYIPQTPNSPSTISVLDTPGKGFENASPHPSLPERLPRSLRLRPRYILARKHPRWFWWEGSPNYTLKNTILHGQVSQGQKSHWHWKKMCWVWTPCSQVLFKGTVLHGMAQRPQVSLLGEAHWNCPPWPGTIGTICMSCFTTWDPGKEQGTNKPPPTRRVRERSKGDTTCPTTSQNPPLWHPSWLNKACTTRKDSESEWLAKDN